MKKYALILTTILLLLASCSGGGNDLESLRKNGRSAFNKGDYDKALEYLRKGLSQSQSDKEILFLLGQTFEKQQNLDSAYFYYKRCDLLHPKDKGVNQSLYDISITLQDYEQAIKSLQSLIAAGDSEEMYWQQLAELYLRVNNGIRAYIYYTKLLEKYPDEPKYYLMSSNIASHIDSLDAAIRITDAGIKKFGDREELLINKAIYLAGMGKYSQAEKIFRSQLEKSSNKEPIKLNLANVLTKQDNFKKKREGYNLYVELKENGTNFPFIDSVITQLETELGLK